MVPSDTRRMWFGGKVGRTILVMWSVSASSARIGRCKRQSPGSGDPALLIYIPEDLSPSFNNEGSFISSDEHGI